MAQPFVLRIPPLDIPTIPIVEQDKSSEFYNRSLLTIALTHSSYLNENPRGLTLECNERLEFLGDAVLDLAVADALYARYPDQQEGILTLIRAAVVNGKTLARVARTLDIGQHLIMGTGEEKSGGRDRASNLAAAFEAIVGAVFLDRGYDTAKAFCLHSLDTEIDATYRKLTDIPEETQQFERAIGYLTRGKHPKSALQELIQSRHGVAPDYGCDEPTGMSHQPTFTARVSVNGELLGTGIGASKKAAETEAAKAALAALSGYRSNADPRIHHAGHRH